MSAQPLPGDGKILVAYFSRSGNTRAIANHIRDSVGGDIFEIEAAKPYPRDYDAVVAQARQELKSGYKPPLKRRLETVDSYGLILVGYPIWCGTIPAPVKTFLSEHDFAGKAIAPFCTHGGGGPGRSVADISRLCPKSILLNDLAMEDSDVKTAEREVLEWLRSIKAVK
jgi:flavodoxin